MEWVKDKITELSLTAALILAGIQVITPMFIDLFFDGLIIGIAFLAAKVRGS